MMQRKQTRRESMRCRDKLYINGEWVASSGDGFLDVENPATERIIGQIPEGTAKDAQAAVLAARNAAEKWAFSSSEERGILLTKLQHGLNTRYEELASVICSELGMPLKLSRRI